MIKIREMEDRDIDRAAEIEAENFSRPWTREGFLKAIEDKKTIYLIAEIQEEIVGYIGMWVVLDEAEITNVSVEKKVQGQGIGRQLMEALLTEGEKAGVASYFLEVRESNKAARKLYRTCGFEETGIRRNFYEAPREDAVVMCKR